MNVLVIGGTGVISVGIVEHLRARGATVTVYNRGRRDDALPEGVLRIQGDRSDASAFEGSFARSRYDVVIDMICFTAADAESTTRAFGGRCEQLQFCSTVCVYGTKIGPRVLIDEKFVPAPASAYAKGKLACERIFERAAREGLFAVTILRPSHTYGPGGPLIDQLELDGAGWDRVARGLPVFCAGDGLGLWQSTHRDDCGKLFAYAALNPKTYGEVYNATRDEIFTWRDYHREAAAALDAHAELVFAPVRWLLREAPHRFGLLRDVTQFHGAYSSEKAKRDVPEFRATVGFENGARATFADIRRRGAWRDGAQDVEYEHLVRKATAMGFETVSA